MMAKWRSLGGEREERVGGVIQNSASQKIIIRMEEVVPAKRKRTKAKQWSVSQEWSFVGLFPPVVA